MDNIYICTFFVGNFVENREEREWRPAKKNLSAGRAGRRGEEGEEPYKCA